MSLNRLLRYINLLVAFALVAILGAVYWFAYRVLPKTSGEISAPVSNTAKITRDEIGVPHIFSESIEDALFLQGYVTAQDRLFQMDALRRVASGTLSEVLGPRMIDNDREARRLRLRRIAEAHYGSLSEQDRAYLSSYALGVNHFLKTHLNSLPLEFTLLNYNPRPWTVTDSILIGLLMFRDLTMSWRDEIRKRDLLAGGEEPLVSFLFPAPSPGELQPGSNAWAVSGKWTASGKPILSNDTHLQFTIPSTWYMVHLKSANMDVTGFSLPGAPSVIIGHNDRIAWGVTNLHYDVQDLYIEKFNPATGQYVFRGQVEQARAEREVIPVKGGKPVEVSNWVTRHGPIWSSDGEQYLSMKWVAAEPGAFAFPFVQLNAARNWEEFRRAVARFPGPAQNFVYADVEGNIGLQVSGMLPIRKNYAGDVPVDGSSGEFEWEGYIPFEELPSTYNPPSGFVISANQNPFPAGYPYRVNGSFAPDYRTRQIHDLLNSKNGWKPEEMLAVQKDVYSLFSHFLANQVVAAYEKRGRKNASLTDAVELLRSWDGQMEKTLAAPLLIELVYQQFRQAVAERAAPGKGSVYDLNLARPVIERLLRERPEAWFADYDQVLLRSLIDALEEGGRTQGGDVKKWNYGIHIELQIRQPVGSRIPLIGPYFNIGPIPMSGSPTTVKQTTQRMGPSQRMNVDLANLDNSLANITIGQSGQFLSWHYRDQWKKYYVGESFPMRYTAVAGDVITVIPGE